jgi:hypothetical protein
MEVNAMKINKVKVTVYQRKRRYGTKGKTKGPGHAKSVVKLVNELEIGDSVFNQSINSEKNSKNSSGEDSTIKVFEKTDVDSAEATRFMDAFEKKTDNLAVQKKMSAYTEAKGKLLAEYGVESSAQLTEAAKERFKKQLARKSFVYYEYQAVISWSTEGGDTRSIHSHRMKSVQRRPESSWTLKSIPSSDEGSGDGTD